MNIYQKMAAITADLNAVAKNLRVGEGRNEYKAVGEADVLAAVKPLEAKHGVYSYPVKRSVIDSDLITVKKTYKGETSESSKFFMRVETVYRFLNIDAPEEFIDITTYGDGIDAADKAPGKAMTYGDKYALLKAYKIITGDDPDQKASDESQTARAREIICQDCGAAITPVKSGDKMFTAAEIALKSRTKYGKNLCWKCAAKAREVVKS